MRLLDGRLEHLSRPSGVSVSPIRRRSVARVRSISLAVSSRDDVPGHAGRRDALALGELGGGDAGVLLDLDEQGHLAAVTPSEWISRRSSRARRSSTGRSRLARVPLPRAADSFVVLIINLVNYSNDL